MIFIIISSNYFPLRRLKSGIHLEILHTFGSVNSEHGSKETLQSDLNFYFLIYKHLSGILELTTVQNVLCLYFIYSWKKNIR